METKRKLCEILNELMNDYGTDLVASELNHVKKQRILYYELIKLFVVYDCYLSILLRYLTLEDITRLDWAIKSHELRALWLQNLQKNYWQDENIMTNIKNDGCINWCALKSIKFKSVSLDKKISYGVTDDGLFVLAKLCEKVTKISLIDMSDLSSVGLTYLAAGCPKLKELITTKSLCNDSLKSFGNFCRELEIVEILGHRDSQESTVSSTVLTLPSSSPIKSEGIRVLKSNCLLLKKLTFRHDVENVNGGSEDVSLVKSFPPDIQLNIEDIFISNIIVNDDYMKALALGCKYLKSVNFDRACITDQALRAIGANCLLLQSIIIHEIGSTPETRRYTDDGLKALAIGCPLLKKFNIQGTSLTRDHGIIALAQHCPQLEDIILNSYNISDDGFVELGKLTNLKTIELWKCSNITDNSISSLVLFNRSIKKLKIACSASFTDDLLSAISSNCPSLESLNFVHMGMDSDFTKPALINLVFKCKKINHIHLNTTLPDPIKQELDKRKELSDSNYNETLF